MENTQTQTETVKQVIELIYDMDDNDLIQLNNEYCQDIRATDSEIWPNDDDFLTTFFPNNPGELVRAIFYGNYNYSHNWVIFNGYGNLETFDWFEVKDLCELVPTMAEYITENPKNFSQFDEIDFNFLLD